MQNSRKNHANDDDGVRIFKIKNFRYVLGFFFGIFIVELRFFVVLFVNCVLKHHIFFLGGAIDCNKNHNKHTQSFSQHNR